MFNNNLENSYIFKSTYLFKNELTNLPMEAGTNPITKCFFSNYDLEYYPNAWQHEIIVVIQNREIIAYFRSDWRKSLDIIKNWYVAEKNHHSYRIYEKFIKHYLVHCISDIRLYEATKEEFFKWK